MIHLFSFFIQKKEKSIPTSLSNHFQIEEYSKIQDKILAFFESKKIKIEKIREGIIFLQSPLELTGEEKFSIEELLDRNFEDNETSIESYWEEWIWGYDYKKIKKWETIEKYISFKVFEDKFILKKALIYQWISDKEKSVYVLKLPHRTLQIPKEWLKLWGKSEEDLRKRIFSKEIEFLAKNQPQKERIGESTKRRNKIGEVEFNFGMTINHNLVDRKSGMINDACPLPDNQENYTSKIRFVGGDSAENEIPSKKK